MVPDDRTTRRGLPVALLVFCRFYIQGKIRKAVYEWVIMKRLKMA
jgi:hypothetical protein